MGGYVLFNLLERYPERLTAACFLTTRANADDEAGKARRLQLAQEVMKFGPQAIADSFEQILFAGETLRERPKLVGEVYGWMTGTDSRGLAGGLLAMRERKDYTPLLGNFTLPALAIGAEEDKAAPPDKAREIAGGIPGCRLCIIPQAGHMANLENPGAYQCLPAGVPPVALNATEETGSRRERRPLAAFRASGENLAIFCNTVIASGISLLISAILVASDG